VEGGQGFKIGDWCVVSDERNLSNLQKVFLGSAQAQVKRIEKKIKGLETRQKKIVRWLKYNGIELKKGCCYGSRQRKG
jgi:hypothetical protein